MSAIEKTIDLYECAREPIETPGTTQSHGLLIAATLPGLAITHASANAGVPFGLPVSRLLTMRLPDLIGEEAVAAILAAVGGEGYAPSNVLTLDLPTLPATPGRRVSVLAHRIGDRVSVEIEEMPAPGTQDVALSHAQAIINGLKLSTGLEGVCASAVRDIRALTGYDRVMVYRFDEDGNGTVVAEARDPALAPFLHLHYPASDIPAQARRLYVLQRVRAIGDVDDEPVPLLARGDLGGAGRFDMTFCSLRTPSPVHCQYMRNMGTRATLTVSLVHDDALWGMIVCHHAAPRYPAAHLRALCDLVGQLLSVLVVKAEDAALLGQRLRREQVSVAIGGRLATAPSIFDGLVDNADLLLDLVGAQGALVRLGGRTAALGTGPPEHVAVALAGRLRADHGEAIAADDRIGARYPDLAACADVASGTLNMPVSNNPSDVILWFRGERAAEVVWGGDPRGAAVRDPATGKLGPRASFAAWREVVRGRSTPWTKDDLRAAGQLRRVVTAALLRHAEQRLARLDSHDALTGLGNRRALEAALASWQAAPADGPASVIAVALDRFTLLNESYGHAAGDALLQQVAQRLWQVASQAGVIARLGGDGFAVFCPGLDAAEAGRLAEDLLAALRDRFDVAGRWHRATASIGVATAQGRVADLLREADAAAHASKRAGGDRCTHYDPGHHAAVLNNLRNEQDLFQAVENEQFELHFQPVVTAATGRVRGFEALLRWRHPERGYVPPSDFIPCAEETGLIIPIGRWVLGAALRQLAAWHPRRPDLVVAVNASARELERGDYAAGVGQLLAETGVPARQLCIEVTETTMMRDAAVRELTALRDLGVLVALDDFGTGYSSLSALHALPIDKVKIDRSFVAAAGRDAKAASFFEAIVRLGLTLDLTVVAEGIETQEQLRLVRDAGCHGVQGYLFSPAVGAAAADACLETTFGLG